MTQVIKAVKVAEFKKVFDELDKGRIFVRICDLRKKMNLPREEFDEILRKLCDAEVIQLHEGDASTMTREENNNCFTDENGVRMGTVTFIGNSEVTEIEIEVTEPEIIEVKDDFDYAKLTVKELKELAKFKKIKGYSRMRKAELVAIFSGEVEAPKAEMRYTVKFLREVAKAREIKGYSKMRKSELETALASKPQDLKPEIVETTPTEKSGSSSSRYYSIEDAEIMIKEIFNQHFTFNGTNLQIKAIKKILEKCTKDTCIELARNFKIRDRNIWYDVSKKYFMPYLLKGFRSLLLGADYVEDGKPYFSENARYVKALKATTEDSKPEELMNIVAYPQGSTEPVLILEASYVDLTQDKKAALAS